MHIVSFTRVHVVAIVEQAGGLNDVDVLGGADGLGTLDGGREGFVGYSWRQAHWTRDGSHGEAWSCV